MFNGASGVVQTGPIINNATQIVVSVPPGVTTGPLSVNTTGNVIVPAGNFTSIVRNVTTFAGDGTQGFADNASALAAQFNNPWGGVFDASGNMYVIDRLNFRIRRIAAGTGAVTTYAGNGTQSVVDNANPLLAQFNTLNAIAIDAAGNLYVADVNRIRRIAAGGGAVTTYAGSATAGFADNADPLLAQFNVPQAIAIDAAGNLFVADGNNHRIRRIAAGGGAVTTIAGNGTAGFADNATATAAQFNFPGGIAIDASGNLFVADRLNNCIRRIAAGGGAVTTVAGNRAVGFFNNTNPLQTTFNNPSGIALDASGNLFVADLNNNVVRRVGANGGAVTTYAGSSQGFADGAASSARFFLLRNVVFDATGNLYVFDAANHRIRRITP